MSEAPVGVGLNARAPGGVSARAANNVQEYSNPPADPRINSIITKTGSPLQQGIIQQTDDNVIAPQRFPYACRFMFNPTAIVVSYGTDESVFDPATLSAAQAAGVAVAPGKTSISFSLLFDRTFEVAYGPSSFLPRDLRDIGVSADIGALESVVGARFNFAADSRSVIQPMGLRPCYFIFGGGNNNVGLSFIGAITSMTVTYSSFSERMVPVRAGVEINAVQYLGKSFDDFRLRGGTLLQRASRRGR